MPVKVQLTLSPKEASEPATYTDAAARAAKVRVQDIAMARVVRRSIDARRGAVKVNLTVELYIDGEAHAPPVHFEYGDVSARPHAVIVGAGPAGLFAALRLIERGLRPIILERGKTIAERKKDIAAINRNLRLDPDSNYAFGEGGAGTFSDGKLYTRSKKRGDYNRALQVLVHHGASPEILSDAHPHIGTDRLPGIITAMRRTIETCGGEVIFGARLTGIETNGGRLKKVSFLRHGCTEHIEISSLILATGHSACDVYRMLHGAGIRLEAKNFAMGVRIEHPQQLIDSIQYRMPTRGEYLPAASYSLVQQVHGRGVYSFCMCPGGFIVPAMTEVCESVVNGMSPSGRNSPLANSGIVTEIRQEDFLHLQERHGVLAGLCFQQELEQTARRCGGEPFRAPAQGIADFVAGKTSRSVASSSYVPGLTPSGLHEWLPGFMAGALREGIAAFGRKVRGFVTNEGIVAGVESRTSTPVRIPRNPHLFTHPEVAGLYPCGEGAGFAGGIISAALDGQRVADALADNRKGL
ncbi:MAG: FAD-dependent monooxygenase [Alistipes sp.]|nr:FAD-dependent monooxygenase [Alistipes sp.]